MRSWNDNEDIAAKQNRTGRAGLGFAPLPHCREESVSKRKATFLHDDDFLCTSLERLFEDSPFPSQRQLLGSAHIRC